MVGGISGVSSYSTYYMNMNLYRNVNKTQGAAAQAQQLQQSQQAQQSQTAQRAGTASSGWTVRKPSDLETPVQPVDAVKKVNENAQPAGIDLPLQIRQGADPAEMAVRMRIKPYQEDGEAAELPGVSGNAEDTEAAELPGIFGDTENAEAAELGLVPGEEDAEAAELGLIPGEKDAENSDLLPGIDEDGNAAQGAAAAQKALEDGECETCEKRKYQDGSDDMSVSFQTPTNIKPEQVASAVRGHEMEHVIHEQAKAKQENRKVVSQSVTLHTDICPECGKVYISGGETRTTTKANPEQVNPAEQSEQENQNNQMNGKDQKEQNKPFSVLA